VIFYLKQEAKFEYQQWDANTATAADFAVQIEITDTMWKKFNDDFLNIIRTSIKKGSAAPNHEDTEEKLVIFEAYLE